MQWHRCRAPLRLIAYLAGFDGNSDRGLRLVEEAAQYPGETRRNALFTLVLLYNREGRHDAALQVDSRSSSSSIPAIVCFGWRRATRCCEQTGRPRPLRHSKRGSLDSHAIRGGVRPARNRAGSWHSSRHEGAHEIHFTHHHRHGAHFRADHLDAAPLPRRCRAKNSRRRSTPTCASEDRMGSRRYPAACTSGRKRCSTSSIRPTMPQRGFRSHSSTEISSDRSSSAMSTPSSVSKVGLVLWRDNPRVPAFGMAPNASSRSHVDSRTIHSGGR